MPFASKGLSPKVMMVVAMAALVAASFATLIAMSGTAEADAGSCAVRQQGPNRIAGSKAGTIFFAYQLRNKCKKTYSMKVYLPAIGRSTFCAAVNPGASVTFTHVYNDRNWQARVC